MNLSSSLRKKIIAAVFVLLIIAVSVVLARTDAKQAAAATLTKVVFMPMPEKSPDALANDIQSAGLPVAKIVVNKVPNARGTVVFIPQNHQTPGTNPADPVNDSAAVTQNQIKEIVSYLTGPENIGNVMTEGELYGPAAPDRLKVIGQELNASTALDKAITDLQGSCNDTACIRVLTGASALKQMLDREAILAGGPNDLKAAGAGFAFIGAENASTREAATNLVRDYYYLSDRISSLNSASTAVSENSVQSANPQAPQSQIASQIAQFQALLSKLNPPITDVNAADLDTLASLYPNLNSKISNLASAVNLAHDSQTSLGKLNAQSAAGMPSRADNPYNSETDLNQLQSQLKSVEDQMQTTVVDRRNTDTANNFVRSLGEQNATTEILVFGAGHTSGLLKNFKDRGLNVVVIVPQNLSSDQDILQALAPATQN